MKRILMLALAAVALAVAAPSAFATRVVFDPPPPGGTDCTISSGGLNDYTPCTVTKSAATYSVAFVACSTLTGLNPPANGWCVFMTNVTGNTLGKFTFEFTAPVGGSSNGSDVLSCGSQPVGFATNNCNDGATVSAGDVLDLTFFAPVANNTNFYLITDFVQQPDAASVTASVPEPNGLALFGLGLLALGVGFGWQRRRRLGLDHRGA